jgi:hypothetical protein
MAEALRAAGVPVECRIYGGGHMATVLALSPLFRFEARTLADVREFLDGLAAGTRWESGSSEPCPSVRGRKSWDRPLPQPYLLTNP